MGEERQLIVKTDLGTYNKCGWRRDHQRRALAEYIDQIDLWSAFQSPHVLSRRQAESVLARHGSGIRRNPVSLSFIEAQLPEAAEARFPRRAAADACGCVPRKGVTASCRRLWLTIAGRVFKKGRGRGTPARKKTGLGDPPVWVTRVAFLMGNKFALAVFGRDGLEARRAD